MDLACLMSKDRDYPFNKAFTTGKSPSLGGVPHDTYGMTTRSVRQYVTGIYRKLNLNEKEVTKIITGGPDGDLGSNEILMGNEKITAIIDGSGVLYEPSGLNKMELDRLAKGRLTCMDYSAPLVNGYKVSANANNITLPSGEEIISGENFRNTFILRKDIECDILVPCGGRPESVNPYNFHKLFKEDGTPRFKYIVEGANLFVSENVRPRLQQKGITLFKDASTNKGGVTSSSMEVLAALGVEPTEFNKNFQIKSDGTVPELYSQYVSEIIERVEENARLEFEHVWEEIQKGRMSNEATNKVSIVMNDLFDVIHNSELYDDEQLRDAVLLDYLPELLKNKYGYKQITDRLPEGYKRTAFAVWLSSRFVYKYGIDYTAIDFINYIQSFRDK